MRTSLTVLLICCFCFLSVALLSPVPSSRLEMPPHNVSEEAYGTESWTRGVVSEHDTKTKDRLFQKYVRVPMSFEANYGQTDSQVRFVSRGAGYSLFLTTTEAVIALGKTTTRSFAAESISSASEYHTSNELLRSTEDPSVLRMSLSGANPAPKVIGQNELPAKANYFIGKIPNAWHTNVPAYATVKYEDVYTGVDLIYYGNQQELEYDFIVNPSASPASIRIEFEGMSNLELDKEGNLVISTSGRSLKQSKPVIYQHRNGETERVEGGYVLIGDHSIGFQVGEYDHSAPLIIDPVLSYSTYLGGTNQDIGWGIAVDPSGYIYATGYTSSIDFPTSNAVQPVYRGPFPQEDVFVTKLTPDGSALVYSTYLGGSRTDEAFSIAVDSAGNAHIVGLTLSSDFPTSNALQPDYRGGEDGFVAKLNPTGSQLVFSTFLGGTTNGAGGVGHDRVLDVDLDDDSGEICVTGFTLSSDFPVANALQPFSGSYVQFGATFYTDAFVTKLNAAGSAFIYSTYLGANSGSQGFAVTLDGAGNAYVGGVTTATNFPTVNAFQNINRGGEDAFVTKLNPSGSAILYSSYFGGSRSDNAGGIGLDGMGNVYIAGTTESQNLAVANATQATIGGSFDAYVAKLDTNLSGTASLLFATYLGGTRSEFVNGGIADRDGNFYVAGNTTSLDFPTVSPFQSMFRGGGNDVFVAKLRPDGTTVYSSYLGGTGNDVAIHIAADVAGNAYVTGSTDSINFPTVLAPKTVKDCCSHDSFITKIADPPPSQPPTAVCHDVTVSAAASCASGALIDNGSFDPDGDPITIIQSPQSPYPIGNTVVTLTVTDSRGASSECTAMVTVVDDTPPSLGSYPTTAVTAGGNSTITPNAAPLDNCSVMSATAAAAGVLQSPFTGLLTVNPSTGVVTVTDAKPAGTYTVTVTATDNSGLSFTSSFTLMVNNPANCAPESFTFSQPAGSPFGVESVPASMVLGDFNGDGKQDLATANYGSNNLTVLLGNGSGGFNKAATTPINAGTGPYSLTVGDFNGDGMQDLAVANRTSNNLTILLGNGIGGFGQAATSPVSVGGQPQSIAMGDFNNDGKQDLVAGNDNNLTILLGDGFGGFAPAAGSPVSAGSGPVYVVVGEFNRDNKQDLAIANQGSNNVTVLLGNGIGGFAPAANSPVAVGTQPLSLALGEFNGDGEQDIAVTANVGSSNVTILLGNGIGGFSPAADSPASAENNSYSVAVGDFNGDGMQDLAVANHNPGKVTILLGNGSGGFSPAASSPIAVGFGTSSVVVGDFNSDGTQDFAAANQSSDNVTILLNTCIPNTAPAISAAGVTRQEGNSSANSVVATVNDAEDAKNLLTVTANGSGSATVNGVTVSTLSVDNGGVVTADVIAACGASNASFVLTVMDSGGLIANATLNVTVTANSPPVLGTYPSAGTINLGAGTSVIPSATPSDNVSISHISASAPGFTGDFSVDQTTGVVTISSAGPAGVYTVTVSADDNCNATSNVTFPLEVNATPMINGTTISRQQGSPASNSQIATITDADQSATTLMVSANQATGSGVVLSNITINSEGEVFADAVASCNAVNSTFTLTVTDNHGAMATATLTIIVTANNAPTMGTYQTVTVNPGTNTNVTPNTIPTDNGSVTLLMASASGFTGTLSGNASTGVITISNAAPTGSYTVTVTATDNCGAISTTTFTLIVNTPPTITGVTISRQRGSSASVSQIATVSDVNQVANTLAVAVNGGTSASVNGVTVNSVSVDALGRVTASVVASCGATNASFTLSVIDSLGMTTTATLMVNVLANASPFLGNYPSAGVLNLGAGTTVTPDAVPGDNGSITNLIASAPGFTGSLSVNPTNGVVTVVNAGPKGNYTVTVTATDNCGATVNRSFTLKVNANR